MSQTRKEIRKAWDKEHLRTYNVYVHKENEQYIMDYLCERQKDGEAISAVFKRGINALIDNGE